MVFYQPPVNPGFFHEILNMSNSDGDNTALCTIVYNHIDLLRLQNIFGTSFGETIVDDPKQFIAL